ncbi:hypothetical protein Tco_1087701, partial [Tanacetum coccineum]
MDMFRDTLQLPVETPANPFVAPANIHTIEAFMNRVRYQGVVDKVSAFFTKNLAQPWQTMFKKKEAIQYPRFAKLIITDLMKKFSNIPMRIYEAYHYIKDDVPLVSVYTTGNVLVQGMLISDAFLTVEIRETDDFKEYETVFMKVAVLMNQPQPVFSTKETNRNTPKAHRSPTVSASPLEKKKRKQTAGVSSSPRKIIKQKKQSTPSIPPLGDDRERDAIAEAKKLDEGEIDKMVKGSTDDESYASKFSDSILNNEGVMVDDTGSKIEPGSQKENLEEVEDYTNVELERTDEVVKETKVANMSGSQETRNEQTQTPISSPIRSPRKVSFSDKTISEDLKYNLSPATATTSKTSFTTKHKKISFTLKTRNPPGCIAGMGRRRNLTRSHIKNKFITREFFVKKIQEVLQHYDTIIPELTVSKTNEMLKKEMPCLVQLAVNKDREVSLVDISGMLSKEFAAHGPKLIEELFRKHMQNTTLNLYPKTRSSTATTSSADLQQQLYLNMKTKPQDQATDPEIWEIWK